MQDCEVSEVLPTHIRYRHQAAALIDAETALIIAVEGKWTELADSENSIQELQNHRCNQNIEPQRSEIGYQQAADGDCSYDTEHKTRMPGDVAFRSANQQ
jgi:hypothetical protein